MKAQSFNTGWTCSAYGKEFPVTLPYDCMVGSKRAQENATGPDIGFFEPVRATYRKTFEMAEVPPVALVHFDGVMGLCEVRLNDQKIGFHPYGYTAFCCDLKPYLQEGENTLVVTADTTAQVASRWYTGCGIYRDVTLLTSDGARIAPWGIQVFTRHLHSNLAELGVNVRVISDKPRSAVLKVSLLDETHVHRVSLAGGEEEFSFRYTVEGFTPWTPDTPELYTCDVCLDAGEAHDEDQAVFGIRIVETDERRGVLINGQPVKLYGGCVHHDNGIVGAASFAAAEQRRVRILKEQGFNAIRCAHNPPSTAMLDACDRLGMLVIDEIFDAWRVGKKDYDYHLFFDGYWEADTRSMVLRDRNHPSVILWSTGNEIPEKNGSSGGYQTHKKILDVIRSLDPTRPVTHALCTFWDSQAMMQKDMQSRDLGAEQLDFWAEKTAPIADLLEVAGYNYEYKRLDKDELRFPHRLIAMTESFPLDAGICKRRMDSDARFVGEFVWTSWDYFGETCIGHITEPDKNGYGLLQHPNHIANCGDMDICGFRKPQSYYRQAMWRKDAVTVLSAPPAMYGKEYGISPWGFHVCDRTWTYPGDAGKMTDVFVFSLCDEVELFVNGVSQGKKTPDETGTAKFAVEYQPGAVSAKAYRGGVCVSEDAVKTTGAWTQLRAEVKTEPARDLLFVEVELLDADGQIAWTADDEVAFTVEGGKVVGTGSGKIDDEHIYTEAACRAHHGRLLCAVLPEGDKLTVTAQASGQTATLDVAL